MDFLVIFTPLGMPVVPLVYKMQAILPLTTGNLSKVLISSLSMSDIFRRITSFTSDLACS